MYRRCCKLLLLCLLHLLKACTPPKLPIMCWYKSPHIHMYIHVYLYVHVQSLYIHYTVLCACNVFQFLSHPPIPPPPNTHTHRLCIQMRKALSGTFFVVFDGNSCRSSRLYPGIRPGRSMAFFSAKLLKKVTRFLISSNFKACLGNLLELPWTLVVRPVTR